MRARRRSLSLVIRASPRRMPCCALSHCPLRVRKDYRMAATASQDAVPPGEPMHEGGGWLDADWVVLPAEALPGLPGRTLPEERRFVLLHPARGMAILD